MNAQFPSPLDPPWYFRRSARGSEASPAASGLEEPRPPGSGRPGTPGVWILLALLVAAPFCPPAPAADGVPPSPGVTEPILDVTLSAPVPGILTSRKFKEGEFIQEGQVLLELDKRLEELEVDRRKLVTDQKREDY